MSKRLLQRHISLIFAAIAGCTLASAYAGETSLAHAGAQPPREDTIPANEVHFTNLKAFEAQIRRDLPVGTSKAVVEDHLRRIGIPHFYADKGSGGDTFYGTIKNIGARMGFEASLAVRIHLDAKGNVDKIWFRVDYDAP